MTVQTRIGNALTRNLERMFPGFFVGTKHNHYADFGYPSNISFDMLYHMYKRNGLAQAAVQRTVNKTWQSNPELWETEDPDETSLEAEIRRRFDDLRFWQRLAEADRRALVGGYSAVVLRFADGQRFDQPVSLVRGGLLGLVEVIPVWASQLTVVEWVTDETSDYFGQPSMFQFNEVPVGNQLNNTKPAIAKRIHPNRVLVWSSDDTVNADSFLSPGYNDLIDLEKIKGAGGEGFWKNARSAPVLEIDKDAKLKDMAAAMNVDPSQVADAMNEQVDQFQKGFDQVLMLQGMVLKGQSITLPSPEHFFNIALQSFAASITMPIKILVGSQTGERASTEDANEWNQSNMGRRTNWVLPSIRALIHRLEEFRVLPEKDWVIHWDDLTEATMAEKLDRAAKMADINQKQKDSPVFLVDEIRAAVDLEPEPELDEFDDEEEDDPMKDDPEPPEDPEDE